MKSARGDDLETIPVADADTGRAPEAEPEPAPPVHWQVPVLVACAVVSTIALVTIAVMEWRQADVAREQACVNRAMTGVEFETGFRDDPGVAQRRRLAECYGLDADAPVPNVVGLPLVDARMRLEEAGFVPEVENGDPARFDAVVSAQEPGSGVDLPRGSVIGLRTRSAGRS